MEYQIARDHPLARDVTSLLETHLAFANEVTPANHIHALDVEQLTHESITFFSARGTTGILGVGALKELDACHGELKSMHTMASARGIGVGRAIVEHLLDVARARGYKHVSLETGTYEPFLPARRLYESLGFAVCPPFDQYSSNEFSVCMTISLD